MCESTQAGGQYNPKAIAEMQRINLFQYLANWRIPKEKPGQQRHEGEHKQHQARGRLWGCCLHPFTKGLHTCSLPPCPDLLCAFYDLWSLSQQGAQTCLWDHLQVSVNTCVISRQELHKTDRGLTAVGIIHGIPHTLTLQASAFPAARSDWANLPSSSPFLHF